MTAVRRLTPPFAFSAIQLGLHRRRIVMSLFPQTIRPDLAWLWPGGARFSCQQTPRDRVQLARLGITTRRLSEGAGGYSLGYRSVDLVRCRKTKCKWKPDASARNRVSHVISSLTCRVTIKSTARYASGCDFQSADAKPSVYQTCRFAAVMLVLMLGTTICHGQSSVGPDRPGQAAAPQQLLPSPLTPSPLTQRSELQRSELPQLPAQTRIATIHNARVVSVEPGIISVRIEDNTVIDCKVQDVGDNGVAIGGVVINAPVDATVIGSLPLRLAEKGMLLKCQARLNLSGKVETTVAAFEHLPQTIPLQKPNVEFFQRPATVADFADCEIVGRVITVNHDVVSVAVPPAKWARRKKINVPINAQSRFQITQRNLKNLQPGDAVVAMEVREFENGERLIKRIAATFNPTRDRLTIRLNDQLVQEFSHLSKAPAQPRQLTSDHFVLHTDISSHQAMVLLAKLENMFGVMSGYFAKRPSRPIECYVVGDVSQWNGQQLPPVVLGKISQRSGVTVIANSKQSLTATVYSCDDHRVVQHEAVHAFCAHTFGGLGPVWYAEGIAEVGLYFKADAKGLQIDPVVIDYLRSVPPQTAAAIISDQQTSGDSWQQYAWRWALCHFLSFNQNYRSRFRSLSVKLMTDPELTESDPAGAVIFDRTFKRKRDQLNFEFAQFVAHLDNGLDANLLRINWDLTPKELAPKQVASGAVKAKRGWQSVGVAVRKGIVYEIASQGQWRTERSDDRAGNSEEVRLLACVISQVDGRYVLGPRIKLGRRGEFASNADGQLLFRCDEDLTGLHDNDGEVEVFVRLPQ